MSEILPGELYNISHQNAVDSYPHRQNYEKLRAALNDEHRRINALATPPAGTEVTVARDYADSLVDRLVNATKGVKNMVLSGLAVSEQSAPDMTVKVAAGDAIVDGIYCRKGLGRGWIRSGTVLTITEPSHGLSIGSVVHIEATSDAAVITVNPYAVQTVATNSFTIICNNAGATSGTCDFGRNLGPFTAPASGKQRLDVVCINSDNTISAAQASAYDAGIWVPPAIASTQRPLAILKFIDSTTSINDGVEILHDCREQGCLVRRADSPEAWHFAIQEAVDALDDTIGGEIEVMPGNYYEEVDLVNKNNLGINARKGATIYRPSASGRCIYANNSTQMTSISIRGSLYLHGNSLAGAIEAVKLKNISGLDISGVTIEANASSTAAYKELRLDTCTNILLSCIPADAAEVGFTTCTNRKSSIAGVQLVTLHGATVTDNEFFDAIAPYIPEVGDKIQVSGSLTNTATTIKVLSYAERKDASTVTVYYMRHIDGTSVGIVSEDFADAGAATMAISASWIRT